VLLRDQLDWGLLLVLNLWTGTIFLIIVRQRLAKEASVNIHLLALIDWFLLVDGVYQRVIFGHLHEDHRVIYLVTWSLKARVLYLQVLPASQLGSRVHLRDDGHLRRLDYEVLRRLIVFFLLS
jgi:hypothetical protein